MSVNCLCPAEILLPNPSVSLPGWACIACDQFTSEPAYWEKAQEIAGDAPSALRLILPECYLAREDEEIPKIHACMKQYLADGTLVPMAEKGYVLTARTTASGTRLGLVAALDLEQYDYHKQTTAPVRATEETIESRIPARVKIRRGAALEIPHVLLLMNDAASPLLEPLYEKRSSLRKVYDFELMLGGGSIEGYALTSPGELAEVQQMLDSLDDGSGLIFAVGDGNHSLASAKAYWEEVKASLSPEAAACHPARYALVELVSIHSPALHFAPIHRVLFGADAAVLLKDWEQYCLDHGFAADGGEVTCLWKDGCTALRTPKGLLEVAALQRFLDEWIPTQPGVKIDYIHGDDTAEAFAKQEKTIAFLLPTPSQDGFFESVINGGSLPRKTFSMGQAVEKRYYLESRRIEP